MKGPEEWFSGTVRIDPLFPKQEHSRGSGALVNLSLEQEPHGILILPAKF